MPKSNSIIKLDHDLTITRSHLVQAVLSRLGLSRTEAADLVEQVLDEVVSTLSRGENVKLSSFGSFIVHQKKERVGRNPKTGEEYPISERQVVLFRPAASLKKRINEHLADKQKAAA